MSEHELTLYDSIDVREIPADAVAVAGYVDGHWPTFPFLAGRFPRARRLSITVTGAHDADFCDCEQGDLSPDGAIQWALRQRRNGVWAPGIYASLTTWPELLARAKRAGLAREHVRVWVAHWTGIPHRCTSKCDPRFQTFAGATQYTAHALGRNLDASLARAAFLP